MQFSAYVQLSCYWITHKGALQPSSSWCNAAAVRDAHKACCQTQQRHRIWLAEPSLPRAGCSNM